MLLAIDAGNTNVVFAVFDGETLVGSWRCATDARRTADEYAVWLKSLMQWGGFDPMRIDGAILGSVVPAATWNLTRLCRAHFGCEPLVVGAPGVSLGIAVRMDRPEEVGADRLVNAVAASQIYDGPFVVVDFGTATTFDVVDADGSYCGGVIAPGINLSMEALQRATAKLPRVDIVLPRKVIGTGTVSAMQSGIFWGYIGLIEGLVARIQSEFGHKMTVIGTGGLAPLFAEATPVIEHIDAELTLRGLRLIHHRNSKT